MTPAELLAPQPPTKPGEDQRPVWGLIVSDLESCHYSPLPCGHVHHAHLVALAKGRDDMGARKYGHRLPVDSGRNSRVDELQEALDGLAYSRQTWEQSRNRMRDLRLVDHDGYLAAMRSTSKAWDRHLLFLRLVLDLLEELGVQSPPRPSKACTDPDKMHGACDGFGGSDYP